jgi:5-hydroxyisourate hydrolase
MGHLSTHVLDTMHGSPAAGMQVRLLRLDSAASPQVLAAFTLDADGRHPGGPLLDAAAMVAGRYRLVFAVAPYFRARGVTLPEPPFIDEVQLDFGIADATGHYHVPLLVSPWSYSTYRGS